MRAGHQPQDRQGARPQDPAVAPAAGGSGDRVSANGLRASTSTPGRTRTAYKGRAGHVHRARTFILAKLRAHDPAKLKDVLADVYREDVPDPADMTKFEWEVILRFMGASPDEIKDVQLRMGRVWR